MLPGNPAVPAEACRHFRLEFRSLPAGQHRNEENRHRQGGKQRNYHRRAEIAKGLPGNAFHKHHRQKHGDGSQRRRNHGAAHFSNTSNGRFSSIVPLRPTAENRFENDDGRIHQHSNAQSQTAKRHDVERHPKNVQRRKSHQQGHWNAQAGNDRRQRAFEKQKENGHGKPSPDDGGVSNFVDTALDKNRPIGDHF